MLRTKVANALTDGESEPTSGLAVFTPRKKVSQLARDQTVFLPIVLKESIAS
jgi:hypothetical protein